MVYLVFFGGKSMYEERYAEFKKIFNSLCRNYDRYNVFFDFVKMSAISIQNAFIKNQKLEQDYLNIIHKYDRASMEIFPKLFSTLGLMYVERKDMYDILGEIYQREGIANKNLSQFFTPFHVSDFMAKTAFTDVNSDKIIREKGYITMSDPCCRCWSEW